MGFGQGEVPAITPGGRGSDGPRVVGATGRRSPGLRGAGAFISGRNALVVRERAATTIQMNSPVVQEPGAEPGRHVVAFVMPAEFTLDTLPAPSDPRILVREVPEHVASVASFTGRWAEHTYQEQLARLRAAVEQAGLEVSGPPRFARFDPPWTPWLLRRNEVVLPVLKGRPSGVAGT